MRAINFLTKMNLIIHPKIQKILKPYICILIPFVMMGHTYSQEINYTASFGGSGGSPFYQQIPPGSRLTSITVWSGARVDGITFAYRTPSGHAQNIHVGGYGGSPHTFEVSSGLTIVGLNIRAGGRVDNIQFIFSNGSTSPRYGGRGGNPYNLKIPRNTLFAGFYGRSGAEIDEIGLLYYSKY